MQRLLAHPVTGPLLARLASRRRFMASMRAIAGVNPPSDACLDRMWQLLEHDDGRLAMPALLGYIAERRTHRARWVGALTGTSVPLTLINGSADPISGAHMVARYRELVSQTDIVEIAEAGHYPQVEAPDSVNAVLLDRLKAPL